MAKLTESHLRKIIKEELKRVLNEAQEPWTQAENIAMTDVEMEKIFNAAIADGNAGGVQEYLGAIKSAPTNKYIAVTNTSAKTVMIVPFNLYQTMQKKRAEGMSSTEVAKQLDSAAIVSVPFKTADILSKYGLKMF